MPNWISNTLCISGSPGDVKRLMKLVAGKKVSGNGEPLPFDFNCIDPMPKELARISTGHTTINGQSFDHWYEVGEGGAPEGITPEMMAEIRAKTGAVSWYDWSCDHWGTKWNACHAEAAEYSATKGRAEVVYRFDTAWAPPEPALCKLSAMFPKLHFHLRWEDEGDGYTHDWTFRAGKITSQDDSIKQDDDDE
jgi:hypothetical protein